MKHTNQEGEQILQTKKHRDKKEATQGTSGKANTNKQNKGFQA